MINVAVLGAGHWGPHLVRNFAGQRRSQVLWVIDLDAQRRADIAERFPTVKTAADPAEAIEDDDVDAIVVATPSSTHYELAKAALERGKHILVEKPLATKPEHARELAEIARDRDRVLVVSHVFLYNTAVRTVKSYIDAGEVGDVTYIAMVRTNLGPIRSDVNAAWDLAAHDVSIANYWLGTTPRTASAVGGGWLNPSVEDVVFATLRYPQDVLVNLHVSWLNPRKAREITVVGNKKMLTFDDMNLNEPIRIYDKGVTETQPNLPFADTFSGFRASIREGDVTIPKIRFDEPLLTECIDFLDCIENGTRPASGGPEAVAVVDVLEAIDRSIRNGGREERIE